MNSFYLEQTTQDVSEHRLIQLNSATEKPISFNWEEIGFSVFKMTKIYSLS